MEEKKYNRKSNLIYTDSSSNLKNPGVYMSAGAGVIHNPGRARDSERYRDRTRGNKQFPNRRRKYLTGKDLTTPLGRKIAIEEQKARYREASKEKIHVKQKIVRNFTKKFPIGAVSAIAVVFVFLLGLIWSYSFLYEKEVGLSRLNGLISDEEKREKIIERELDIKNDMNSMINYAVNELDMVKEDLIQRHYLTSSNEDEVIVSGQ